MALLLNQEIQRLLADPGTVKVLATVDERGFPHAVVKQSIGLGEGGRVFLLEFLESSRSNRNLVRTLWFDGRVSVTLTGGDGTSWQIKGKPVKAHIVGPVFRKYYEEIRRETPDADLAAVWEIEPEEVLDETLGKRKEEEERLHPFFTHLDRLAVNGGEI